MFQLNLNDGTLLLEHQNRAESMGAAVRGWGCPIPAPSLKAGLSDPGRNIGVEGRPRHFLRLRLMAALRVPPTIHWETNQRTVDSNCS